MHYPFFIAETPGRGKLVFPVPGWATTRSRDASPLWYDGACDRQARRGHGESRHHLAALVSRSRASTSSLADLTAKRSSASSCMFITKHSSLCVLKVCNSPTTADQCRMCPASQFITHSIDGNTEFLTFLSQLAYLRTDYLSADKQNLYSAFPVLSRFLKINARFSMYN